MFSYTNSHIEVAELIEKLKEVDQRLIVTLEGCGCIGYASGELSIDGNELIIGRI